MVDISKILIVQRKNLQEQALQVLEIGGGKGIRTLVGGCPNGFQDRLVMTTSISLRRLSFAKDSVIWREFRERTMKFLSLEKCRKPL